MTKIQGLPPVKSITFRDAFGSSVQILYRGVFHEATMREFAASLEARVCGPEGLDFRAVPKVASEVFGYLPIVFVVSRVGDNPCEIACVLDTGVPRTLSWADLADFLL